MSSDKNTPLDPEAIDPESLDRATYNRVVGPALQAAAETAAKRGHKHLFDDMAAMLALVEMVTRLADLYRAHDPQAAAEKATLIDNAATAACVMVFQEAELPPEAIGQCLAALETAYEQIQAQSVIEPGRRYIAMAGSHLDDQEREDARHCLIQASEHIIAAIEAWRGESH
ncbi:hypothetical protein [Salinisphaera sp.]|uniref:hypothetical protein n=1 Tax=Salinisphaera sp. TaxID=1914330 RepID=UPI002D79376C|nr:hypothetical protein [Salinisphaera sp.]HET7313336.1 hypothetical protein [Salinisphaera sp.]